MTPPRVKDLLLLAAAAGVTWYLGATLQRNARLRREIAQLGMGNAQLAAATQRAEARNAKQSAELAATEASQAGAAPATDRLSKSIALLERPNFLQHVRATLDGHYHGMFTGLALPKPELDALRDLLAERMKAESEVQHLADATDLLLDDAPDKDLVYAAATEDVDDQIQSLLGDTDFATFERYQAASRARQRLVDPLAVYLMAGREPLSEDQAEGLAESVPPYSLGTNQWLNGPQTPVMSAETDAVAQKLLSPVQLQAYQQYKAAWDGQILMGAIDRDAYLRQVAGHPNVAPR